MVLVVLFVDVVVGDVLKFDVGVLVCVGVCVVLLLCL